MYAPPDQKSRSLLSGAPGSAPQHNAVSLTSPKKTGPPMCTCEGTRNSPSVPMKCLVCEDCGWVCENHPDQPWQGPHACACGGAGAPCPRCNAGTADEPP